VTTRPLLHPIDLLETGGLSDSKAIKLAFGNASTSRNSIQHGASAVASNSQHSEDGTRSALLRRAAAEARNVWPQVAQGGESAPSLTTMLLPGTDACGLCIRTRQAQTKERHAASKPDPAPEPSSSPPLSGADWPAMGLAPPPSAAHSIPPGVMEAAVATGGLPSPLFEPTAKSVPQYGSTDVLAAAGTGLQPQLSEGQPSFLPHSFVATAQNVRTVSATTTPPASATAWLQAAPAPPAQDNRDDFSNGHMDRLRTLQSEQAPLATLQREGPGDACRSDASHLCNGLPADFQSPLPKDSILSVLPTKSHLAFTKAGRQQQRLSWRSNGQWGPGLTFSRPGHPTSAGHARGWFEGLGSQIHPAGCIPMHNPTRAATTKAQNGGDPRGLPVQSGVANALSRAGHGTPARIDRRCRTTHLSPLSIRRPSGKFLDCRGQQGGSPMQATARRIRSIIESGHVDMPEVQLHRDLAATERRWMVATSSAKANNTVTRLFEEYQQREGKAKRLTLPSALFNGQSLAKWQAPSHSNPTNLLRTPGNAQGQAPLHSNPTNSKPRGVAAR
jgi:hypothetical protein